MNNFKKYAKYYYDMGFNITIISNKKGQYNCYAKDIFKVPYSKWKHLHKSRQTMSEFNMLPWDSAVGIGSVTGYNDLTAIDIDKCSNIIVIKKMLITLGLPKDYEWVVQSGSKKGFHIIIKTSQLPGLRPENVVPTYSPNELFKSYFKKVELLWYTHIVLPPSKHSSGNTYSFYTGKIPVNSPLKVSTETLENFIDMFLSEDTEIGNSYKEENLSWETEKNNNKGVVSKTDISTEVFFENIQSQIINQINKAEYEIIIAVAWFTDITIKKALFAKLKTKKINVKILLYEDKINRKEFYRTLFDLGANIKFSKSMMHNKFCIIDNNIVINGSYNWTQKANSNNENIQISYNNQNLIKLFKTEFGRLYSNAIDYKYYVMEFHDMESEIQNIINSFIIQYKNLFKRPKKFPFIFIIVSIVKSIIYTDILIKVKLVLELKMKKIYL